MLWIPLAMAVMAAGTTPARLSFIEDDYPRALAEARRLNRPLFVEAWAPW
jgi:hypothetical protein